MPSVLRYAAEFHQVWKIYQRGWWGRACVQALRGVTLNIPIGSVFGLVGPNRAGKTTLIKLLLSLTQPTRGEALRLGKPIGDRTTLSRIGYVHDSQAFPSYLTASELLEFYGTLSGIPRARLREAVQQRLTEVGLSDRSQEAISGFSKGMLQRLALAQAVLNDPELLVLDEPTEGMDLLGRQMLHELLLSHQRQGRTAILVSHSLNDIERVCDRVAVIRFGEIAFDGRLDALENQSGTGGDLEGALESLYAGTPT
jgi:ABC-2 type transport system ATP-binding protein